MKRDIPQGAVRRRVAVLVAMVGFAAFEHSPAIAASERIVSIGAAVTETVVALGAASSLVGIDTTSQQPAGVGPIARVGYLRTLGAEGILSLGPTLVLLDAEAGPPGVFDQLRASGVRCVRLTQRNGAEGAEALIGEVAIATGRPEAAPALVTALHDDLRRAAASVAATPIAARVLFVVHPPRSGAALVAGRHTPADAMIALAGAHNAAGDLEGYVPLAPEAAASRTVDVIVVPAGTVAQSGGKQALLEQAGLSRTAAALHDRVVEVEATALAFGPSTGRRVLEFAARIRGSTVP